MLGHDRIVADDASERQHGLACACARAREAHATMKEAVEGVPAAALEEGV
jgi:hypothetical protein